MILLIDNYDSFVFNLSRYFSEMGCQTRVVRNDRLTVAEARSLSPEAIVISPGPCTPREAGVSVNLVRQLGDEIPILGVCLGHQAIAAAYGAKIVRASEPVHGRTSSVYHRERGLFAGLPNPLRGTRYHSLIVDEATLPTKLHVIARSEDGTPMAIAHRNQPVFGVQFHPESVLTDFGHRLLANFLSLAGVAFTSVPAGDFALPSPPADWYSEQPDGSRPVP